MSTYICEKCGCIDNTACGGNYWLVKSKMNFFKDEYSNTHCLCVVCTPTEFHDGSKNEQAGKWHNMFPRKHWSDLGKEHILRLANKQTGNYVNAEDFFKNLESKE